MYRITALLGLLFLLTPIIFGMVNILSIFLSSLAGISIFALSINKARIHHPSRWMYNVLEVVGVLFIIAPYIFGFTSNNMLLLASVLIGFLLVVFSGTRLYFSDSDLKYT